MRDLYDRAARFAFLRLARRVADPEHMHHPHCHTHTYSLSVCFLFVSVSREWLVVWQFAVGFEETQAELIDYGIQEEQGKVVWATQRAKPC